MFKYDTLLKRHPKNPIITPADFKYGPAHLVFNPGQCMYKGKTLLLLSVLLRNEEHGARAHVAVSDDGINFDIHEKPLFFPHIDSDIIGGLDEHPIDFRITQIEDTYYIVRPGTSPKGTVGLLYKTKDFESAEFIDIIALPNNRVPCLFPEKINGMYWRLDRPAVSGFPAKKAGIWIANSPNLTHWGHHRHLLDPFHCWGHEKIGPTPPIKTEKGWLVIIHGVSSNCSITTYSLGAVLLDLNNPEKVIGKMSSYILTPEEDYEYRGRTPGVVFTAGAIADMKTRRLRVYYGAADTCIGLAEGDLDEIVDGCIKGL